MRDENKGKFSVLISKIYRIAVGLLALYAICAGIYKGIRSGSTYELIAWIIIGFIGALIVVFTLLATDFGMIIWGKLTDLIIKRIRKYPNLRLWLIFPGILLSFVAAYLVLINIDIELSLRIFVSAYLVVILPAAVISLLLDDLYREHTRFSKEVSRALQLQDPQAAIELAFTHFEDRLRKRFPNGSKLYGAKLIEAAYGGEKSEFTYSSEGKDRTEHLYNLMLGAYSIFRNPRHHVIVNDDEQKTQAIISLAELLAECVDSSEVREKLPSKESDPSKAAT